MNKNINQLEIKTNKSNIIIIILEKVKGYQFSTPLLYYNVLILISWFKQHWCLTINR